MVTVSTYFDVFLLDLGTIVLWLESQMCLNGSGVKGHLGIIYLLDSIQKVATLSTYSDVFSWDLDIMILGRVVHVTLTGQRSKVI